MDFRVAVTEELLRIACSGVLLNLPILLLGYYSQVESKPPTELEKSLYSKHE
jgi:hypothetical protein